MGLLDLRVQTAKLNTTLKGAQVTNIYDASNGRTYVLKLSVPPKRVPQELINLESNTSLDDSASSSSTHSSWQKRLLLIESGVRLHMTQYDREKDIPSGFCIKLRKHIRTRRLQAVRQLGGGGDRIIDLVFSGEGSVCAHLIVEAFAGGNIILTDGEYNILTLLRTYVLAGAEAEPARVAVRNRYPVENARPLTTLDYDTFSSAASRAQLASLDTDAVAKLPGRVARRKMYARGVARKALAIELAIEPNLLEHSLITAGLSADISLAELLDDNGISLRSFFDALIQCENNLAEEMKRGDMKGYIILNTANGSDNGKETYEEFSPFLFAQYRERPYKEYSTFDEAADEYFAQLESNRIGEAQAKREAAAFKKVDKLKSELNGQVEAYENARNKSSQLAQAIESNITEVEAAITVVRSAIAAAIPWDGLDRMVQDEKRNGNPVAEIIHSLQLENNQITLMLEDAYLRDDDDENDEFLDYDEDDIEDDDEEEYPLSEDGVDEFGERVSLKRKMNPKQIFRSSPESRKALLVPVDIGLSAHANARQHYEMSKSAAAKMDKAVEVKDRTIRTASKKAEKESQRLEQQATAASIRAMRKPFWFEKFYWFVSREKYLVVAGRDTQQNDLLIKRYMGPADVYVHADVDGAASVIVKNRCQPNTAHTEIPQLTLEQAGMFVLCRSAAWESNIVTSAWWVRATQVSKTTSTGLYLPVGSFAIRGRKNFLNHSQLVMGLTFMFNLKTDENPEEESTLSEVLPSVDLEDQSSNICTEEKEADIGTQNLTGGNVGDEARGIATDVSLKQPVTSASSTDLREESVEEIPVPIPVLKSSHGEGMSGSVCQVAEDFKNLSVLPDPDISTKVLKGGDGNSGISENRRESTNERIHKDESNVKPTAKTKVKGNNALPRGKRHKLKKMKKYSDQDEDERRIALAVLGSKPIKEETPNVELTTFDSKVSEVEENSAVPTANARETVDQRQENLWLLDKDGLMELEKLELETTKILESLTTTPSGDDNIEFALPVCAPYDAISLSKYKAKLLPGTMKRGKAYRAAHVLFQRQAGKDLAVHKKEHDAIRLCPDSDGVHTMLNNVKIMAPGLADAQKAIMKEKKALLLTKKSGKQK